jgi:hypothetical protein
MNSRVAGDIEEIIQLIQVVALFYIALRVVVPSQHSLVNLQEISDSIVLMRHILSLERGALIEYDHTLAC